MIRSGRPPWDDRYADGDWVDVREPAAIVAEAEQWLSVPGVALDLACGAGRNALFLAERGWRVLAVDLSLDALRLLTSRAASRAESPDLSILPVLADLERFGVRPDAFDLVINTHFLLRSLFPLIRSTLKAGGILLFETYSICEIEELGGDIRREYTLERGELSRAFDDFELLYYAEGVFEREEGERGLVRMIAQKSHLDVQLYK